MGDFRNWLLSDAVEAFRFDFNAASTFPPEKKKLQFGFGGNHFVEPLPPPLARRLGGNLDHVIAERSRIRSDDAFVVQPERPKVNAISPIRTTQNLPAGVTPAFSGFAADSGSLLPPHPPPPCGGTFSPHRGRRITRIAALESCFPSPPNGGEGGRRPDEGDSSLLELDHRHAAIVRDQLALMMTPEEWSDVISVNLTGTFLVTRAFLPQMRARGAPSLSPKHISRSVERRSRGLRGHWRAHPSARAALLERRASGGLCRRGSQCRGRAAGRRHLAVRRSGVASSPGLSQDGSAEME